jgi:hypothetical protein
MRQHSFCYYLRDTLVLAIVIYTTDINLSPQSFNMHTSAITVHSMHSTSPLYPYFYLLGTLQLLPCIHPFWVFPDPNVLLIRTHPNPFPSIRHNNISRHTKTTPRWHWHDAGGRGRLRFSCLGSRILTNPFFKESKATVSRDILINLFIFKTKSRR